MNDHDQHIQQKKQLQAIISEHTAWEEHPSKERQEDAKMALEEFLSTLKTMQVDIILKNEGATSLYKTHIHYLVWLDRELASQNYVDACCELQQLVESLPISQPHIYWNILVLLERYINNTRVGVTVQARKTPSPIASTNDKKIVIITLSIECNRQKELIQIVERISMMIGPNMILGEDVGHTELAEYTALNDAAWDDYCNKLQQHGNQILKHSKALKQVTPWVVWMD